MDPKILARELTEPQRRALRRRQPSLFSEPAVVAGHGMTMRALRSRGIVVDPMPHAKLTGLGESVCALAHIDEPEAEGEAR